MLEWSFDGEGRMRREWRKKKKRTKTWKIGRPLLIPLFIFIPDLLWSKVLGNEKSKSQVLRKGAHGGRK